MKPLQASSIACLLLSLIAMPSAASPAEPAQTQTPRTAPLTPLTGVVRDAAGGVVQRATVIARVSSGAERQALTDAEGRFAVIPAAAGDVTLIVRVPGFEESFQ